MGRASMWLGYPRGAEAVSGTSVEEVPRLLVGVTGPVLGHARGCRGLELMMTVPGQAGMTVSCYEEKNGMRDLAV